MAFSLLALIGNPAPASGAASRTGEAITFAPSMIFLHADAGRLTSTTLVIKNQTSVASEFVVDIVDAQAGPPPSHALELVPVGAAREGRGAGRWLTLRGPSRFVIPAGTERALSVDVAVPGGTASGGYHAALSVGMRDTRTSGQVKFELRQPVPVLLDVGAGARRDLRVRVMSTDRVRWQGGVARWTVELFNAGDVDERVEGRALIDGMLAGTRSRPMRAAVLLPGERRRQRVAFDLRSAPDRYATRVEVARAGASARVVAHAPAVLVVPWWLLALVVVGVGIVVWRLRHHRSPA